jgi:hypothetical protein
MNQFSIVISGFFVLLLIGFITYLAVAIYRNLQAGKHYRQGIAEKLSHLRLNRMLGVLGIGQGAYLHTQPVLGIRDQMKRCSECTNTRQCDQLLDEGVGDQAEFCANDETLKKVKETIDLSQ